MTTGNKQQIAQICFVTVSWQQAEIFESRTEEKRQITGKTRNQEDFSTWKVILGEKLLIMGLKSSWQSVLSARIELAQSLPFTFMTVYIWVPRWQHIQAVLRNFLLSLVAVTQQIITPPSHRSGCTCCSIALLVPSLCCSILFFTYIFSDEVKSSFKRARSSFSCSLSFPEPACKLQRDFITWLTIIMLSGLGEHLV